MNIEQFTVEHDGKQIVCTFDGALFDLIEHGTTDTIAFAIWPVFGAGVEVSYCENGYHIPERDVTAHYLSRMPLERVAMEILNGLPLLK